MILSLMWENKNTNYNLYKKSTLSLSLKPHEYSSTSSQDGVTETRFKFLPNTTEKRQST